MNEDDAVWDILIAIYEMEDARFIFILDEWNYIFHRSFATDHDKAAYVEFLSNLLKGKAYVELAYMTGILPIAKYSSGSELNMFFEYTTATKKNTTGGIFMEVLYKRCCWIYIHKNMMVACVFINVRKNDICQLGRGCKNLVSMDTRIS